MSVGWGAGRLSISCVRIRDNGLAGLSWDVEMKVIYDDYMITICQTVTKLCSVWKTSDRMSIVRK